MILVKTIITANGVYITHSRLDFTPESIITFFEEHTMIETVIEGLHLAHGGIE